LENHLNPGSSGTKISLRQADQVQALKLHTSTRRGRHLHDRPTRRRLATTALAHNAKRFASGKIEVHTRDRMHFAAPPRWELNDEVLHTQDQIVAVT
jgi:hypothetical protein